MAILGIVLLRLIAPFFLFRFPLGGAILVLGFDFFDYWLLGIFGNREYHSAYQAFDKYLDLYGITFFALQVFRWEDAILRTTAFSLFIVRFIGILAFEATGLRAILFFLPNIFENFYLLIEAGKVREVHKLPTRWSYAVAVLIIAAVPKILQEYFMHYLEYPLGVGTIWREMEEFGRHL